MNVIDNADGFLVHRAGSGGTVEIFDIAVTTERRKGAGRKLIQELFATLDPATRVFAITRAENLIAQKFYEALGFDGIPLRRFYSDDRRIDAVMYIRSAGGSI